MNATYLDGSSIVDYFASQVKKPLENYADYMSTKALDEFAIQLVNYRFDHKINQTQLAHVLGISQPMVSQYEAGTNNITVKRLCEICEKIGVRVNIDYEIANQTVADESPSEPYRFDSAPNNTEKLAA